MLEIPRTIFRVNKRFSHIKGEEGNVLEEKYVKNVTHKIEVNMRIHFSQAEVKSIIKSVVKKR